MLKIGKKNLGIAKKMFWEFDLRLLTRRLRQDLGIFENRVPDE